MPCLGPTTCAGVQAVLLVAHPSCFVPLRETCKWIARKDSLQRVERADSCNVELVLEVITVQVDHLFLHRFPCGSGETTLNLSAASSQDCVCDAGFTPMQSQCLACEIGEFKPEPGSAPCLLCPENYATFASASTSVSSCIPINDGGVIESSNQSGSPRNESQVSTVSLTLSVEGIPSDASLQVRDHLPALLLQSLSEITRQDAALMSLEFGISGTRRLTEAMTVSRLLSIFFMCFFFNLFLHFHLMTLALLK